MIQNCKKMFINKSKSTAVIGLAIALSACSSDTTNTTIAQEENLPPSSSEGGPVGVFNPNANVDVYACEASYYLNLRGLYLGNVSLTPEDATEPSCTWDTTLQVRGSYSDPANTSVCEVSATYSYTLLEGGTGCVDGSLVADLDDPLAASPNKIDWETPEWPVTLPMKLTPGIDDGAIIPASTIAASMREVLWQFDGLGDSILIDNTNADGQVSGTLVKR